MIASGLTLNVSSLKIGLPSSSNSSFSLSSLSLALIFFALFLPGFSSYLPLYLKLSLQKCWSQNTISAVATTCLTSSPSYCFNSAKCFSSSWSLISPSGPLAAPPAYYFCMKSINSSAFNLSESPYFLASSLLFFKSCLFWCCSFA